MLFLAVLCAFHYFLTDIWGSNLFPSRFFLLTFFSLLKAVTSSCLEVSLVFEDCHGWIRDYEDKTVAFSLCLGQGVRGHKEPSPPLAHFLSPFPSRKDRHLSMRHTCLLAMPVGRVGMTLNLPNRSCKRPSAPQDIWLSACESEQREGFLCQIKGMVHITFWLENARNQRSKLCCS